jgi:hypothetical protein
MVDLGGGAFSYERGTPVHGVRPFWCRVTSLIRNTHPLASPQVPRHGATVGSYGEGGSQEWGTPVIVTVSQVVKVAVPKGKRRQIRPCSQLREARF